MLTWSSIVKQFSEQVRSRLILQKINGNSSVLQKLLRYFKDLIILASFVPSLSVLPALFVLNLNKGILLPAARTSIIAPAVFKASWFL